MLKRFAAWLAGYAGVSPTVATERLKGGNDAVDRGQRWEQFYREEGGLRDMLDKLRLEAFEAAAELDPNDTDKIYYWATADRNLRRLQQKVEAVVITGKTETAAREQLAREAKLRIVRAEF